MMLFQKSLDIIKIRFACFAGILFCVFSTVPVLSATFTVDRYEDDPALSACTDASPNDCSLRGAIKKANLNPDHDDIILPSGTFNLTITGVDENLNATGDLDITSDITITGKGLAATFIDGNDLDRVLHLRNNATATLKDLAVTNGRTELLGAGIYQESGSLTIENCWFFSNDAYGVTAFGGGIHSAGPLSISGSIVSGNNAGDSATSGSGGTGGGIHITGSSLNLTKCNINNNTAVFGAGLHARGASGVISYASFLSNSASGKNSSSEGGGVYIEDTPLSIRNTTFSGNTSGGFGGGYFQKTDAASGPVNIVNSTFSGNTARSGGGLHISQGEINLSFVTIADNTVNASEALLIGDGGGLYKNLSPTAVVRLKNAILGDNTDASSPPYAVYPDCSGDIVSMGGNVIENVTGCSGYSGTDDAVNQAPGLSPLADNGYVVWRTDTHALTAGSPAIDFCFQCTDINGSPVKFDQRDVARPYYKVYACDSGAYESEYGSGWASSCPDCTEDSVVIEYRTIVSGDVCNCDAAVSAVLGPDFTVENGGSFTVNSPDITLRPEIRINQGASFTTGNTPP